MAFFKAIFLCAINSFSFRFFDFNGEPMHQILFFILSLFLKQ